ncbi:MAG: glycosyltransferase family 2 protein [Candidatus Cryptobacteroides sp.]|nr:glycosyltransferase family 2 protein [Candidatus Cryptobacteroides sp.]
MVSVIVPVYKVEDYIRECIDSILAQTYSDFELILVDDGSPDNCGRICDDYAKRDNRIKVVHKVNGGISSARNAGLEVTKGEWIMHVDGDDWIEPDMIESLIQAAQVTGADLVFGDFMKYGPFAGYFKLPTWSIDKRESMSNYIAYMMTTIWGSIAKRSLYADHSLKSPEGISYCEDFHLIVRLCHFAKKVVNVHRPFYHYRYRPTSIMSNLNKKTEADEQWVYQDTIRFFKEQGVYEDYRKVMSWRVLKSTQELLLDPAGHQRFMELFNDGIEFIFSCPFVNRKIMMLAWLLTHNLRPAVVVFDRMRSMIGR